MLIDKITNKIKNVGGGGGEITVVLSSARSTFSFSSATIT